jgi:outer membrane protein, multidrug efflux system
MMLNKNKIVYLTIVCFVLTFTGCKTSSLVQRTENKDVPESYMGSKDTLNSGKLKWKDYFTDQYLDTLVTTALANNQELNITMQEIQIASNEIRARKGEYLPFVGLRGGAGVEKVGRYTSQGANDANTEIKPGIETPEALQDYMVGAYATWVYGINYTMQKNLQ